MHNFTCIVGGSILWMLLSIPLITFGPATIALYHSILQCVRRGEGHYFSSFFKSFRKHFKIGALFGIIVLIFTALLLFNIRYANLFAASSQSWEMLSYIYTGILFLLIMYTAVGFPALLRANNSLIVGLKLTFVLSFRHLFTSITCFLVLFLAFQIAINIYSFLLFIPGTCCLVNSLVLEPLFEKENISR